MGSITALERVHQPNTESTREGRRRSQGIASVPSFTEDGVFYDVDLIHGSCSCMRGQVRKDEHKHTRLARSGAPLDQAARGMLADGTRVLILDSREHDYDRRIWGFDPGAWTHTLCHDGERFVVESHRLLTGETRTRAVSDWRTWVDRLPVHANAEAA